MGGRVRREPGFVRRHGDVRQRNPPTPFGSFSGVVALAASPGSLEFARQASPPLVAAFCDESAIDSLSTHFGAKVAIAPSAGARPPGSFNR